LKCADIYEAIYSKNTTHLNTFKRQTTWTLRLHV